MITGRVNRNRPLFSGRALLELADFMTNCLRTKNLFELRTLMAVFFLFSSEVAISHFLAFITFIKIRILEF